MASAFLIQNVVVFIMKLIFLGAVPMIPFCGPNMWRKYWFLSASYKYENVQENNFCLPFIYIYGTIWFYRFTMNQGDINYFALDVLLLILIFITQVVFFTAALILWPLRLLSLLVIGSLLQMCKLITVGKVWNWWFYQWTGENNFALSSQEVLIAEVSTPMAGRVKAVLARNKVRVSVEQPVVVIETFDHIERVFFAPCDG